LVGTAPTPNNFDLVGDTDYDRKTGLVGDGSTKYLDSNRNNNADPQNSKHVSVYSTSITDSNVVELLVASDASGGTAGVTQLVANGTNETIVGRANSSQNVVAAAVYGNSYLTAVSRSSSSTIELLANQTISASASTSQTPNNANINIFGFGSGSSNARLAFYSIGESLDLAALDTRVSNLITAIGAAIP
jgi:ribosomal protein S11